MAENEKVAALAAALDGMKAERNWYRTAWSEAFREREELRVRLDSLKRSEDATSAALAEALARNASLEYRVSKQRRELAELREWFAVAQDDLAQTRAERDELRNWYQAVMEDAEEFGVGG